MFEFHLPEGDWDDSFDFMDLTDCQSIMLRLGRAAYIAVLNDACAVISMFNRAGFPVRIGSKADVQLRELFAHVSYANTLIVNRPIFSTGYDRAENAFRMSAEHALQVENRDGSREEFGQILYSVLAEPLGLDALADDDPVKLAIRRGEWTCSDP
jgi:hypothetical protein